MGKWVDGEFVAGPVGTLAAGGGSWVDGKWVSGPIEVVGVTVPPPAAGSITDAMMQNQKVNRAGDTMTGKLTAVGLASTGGVASGPTDVSKSLDLLGGVYGLSITDHTLNLVTAIDVSATKFAFYEGSTQVAIIQNAVTAANALTNKTYVDGKTSTKPAIVALTKLADPATATSVQIATLLNAVVDALKA